MKFIQKKFIKPIGIVLLALFMLLQPLFSIPIVVDAKESIPTALDLAGDKIADPSTLTNWTGSFGPTVLDTNDAGRIWTDKTVSDTDINLQPANINVVRKNTDNFLVGLSAISSNKSIVGQSNIPVDVMLVLDASASMAEVDANVTSMVNSTNDAIRRLYSLNIHNRVGVVLYSGNSNFGSSNRNTATVLLPLDRYQGNGEGNNEIFIERNNGGIRTVNGLKDGNNNSFQSRSKTINGATYTQNGIIQAWEELDKVEDTVINDGGFQDGIKRIPIMVLMSDGNATTASTNYANPQTSDNGNGSSSSSNGNNAIAFQTQLTAAWVRAQMQDHYERDPLFFTLGLGLNNISTNNSARSSARSVLDPENMSDTISRYWSTYLGLSSTGSMNLSSVNTSSSETPSNKNISINRNSTNPKGNQNVIISDYNYVDEYFAASNAAELTEAFNDIVEQIIIQSTYYPTDTEGDDADVDNKNFDGYIAFEDEIGEYMEVKNISGLVNSDSLQTGKDFAKLVSEGGMGTASNPSDFGDEFIRSIVKRLGITTAEARSLVESAYFDNQIDYNNENNNETFSNFVSWYADDQQGYLGFHGTDTEVPNGAKYINNSYIFIGASDGTANHADLMYLTARVCTEIDTNKQKVILSIPASLIPMVQYDATLTGDLNGNEGVTLQRSNAYPIRFFYEVGLRSDIDALNVASKIRADYPYKDSQNDGLYYFYTNAWTTNTESKNHSGYAEVQFNPSVNNEFYYFSTNTDVYQLEGNSYKLVTESDGFNPNNTYYYKKNVFNVDKSLADDFMNGEETTASMTTEYLEILPVAKAAATLGEDGNYIIPIGTPKTATGNYVTQKTSNSTKTSEYSLNPRVDINGDEVHIDVLLGNNGRLALEQATGIRLSKDVQTVSTEENANHDFNFTIVLKDDAGNVLTDGTSYQFVKDNAMGERTTGTVNIDQGKINVTLQDGDVYYLTGMTADTQYEITEENHPNYSLVSINGDTNNTISASGTIETHVLKEASFVNTSRIKDDLRITKLVTHDMGSNFTLNANQEFTFEVTLTKDNQLVTNSTFPYTIYNGQNVTGTGRLTPSDEGVLTFTLKQNETISINNIEVGTNYSIIEDNLPAGYENKTPADSLTGTISGDVDNIHTVTNHYHASSIRLGDVVASIGGTKTLDGRDWINTDKFTFELWNVVQGRPTVKIDSQPVDQNNQSFSFANFKDLTFDSIGYYYFQVNEVDDGKGGITYDSTPRQIRIHVTDKDVDGKLEINEITLDGVNVPLSNAVNIHVDIENIYEATGNTNVSLYVRKNLVNETGVPMDLSGYKFGLFLEGQDTPYMEETTNTEGLATFNITYLASSLEDSPIEYEIREIEHTPAIPGMTYSDEVYHVDVNLIDNFDGTISHEIEWEEDVNANTAVFTNTYRVESITESPIAKFGGSGTKELTGRDLVDGEFSFVIQETDKNYIPITNGRMEKVINNKDGKFTFKDMTFDKAGTYYFIITEENADSKLGVTYDKTTYRLSIPVVLDETVTDKAQLKIDYNNVSLQKALPNADYENTNEVKFKNSFNPVTTSITLIGEKKLEGREWIDSDEFTFVLERKDGKEWKEVKTFAVRGNQTDKKFIFNGIVFDQAGNYEYRIFERASDNAKEERMTYDESVYLVSVLVTESDSKDKLIADYEITKDGKKVDTMSFTNVYTAIPKDDDSIDKPVEVPTGDHTTIWIWIGAMFIATCVAFGSIVVTRKQKIEK